ncbi:MAG: lysylphosphatidylglycerol synthase domain-containing protein [Candidatus Micrarchaeia archaeon]|jgi:uncharacterized membrane protein YbhN (UPF0104 family)
MPSSAGSNSSVLRSKALTALAYLFVLGAIAYAVIKFLGGENYLAQADYSMFGLALLAYLASVFFWSLAWAKSAKIQRKEAALLTFAAAAGALTPLGVGSDALRGYFSRRDAEGFSHLVLSSIATKLHKIVFSAVAAAVFLALYSSSLSNEILYSALLGIAVSVVSVVLLYLFIGKFSWLSKYFPKKFLPDFLTKGSQQFKNLLASPSISSIIYIAASLAFELVSFFCCFLAFNTNPGLVVVAGAFVVVFFASKVPFLHGFGLLELVGVFLLHNSFPASLLVAILFCFDVARLWFPTLVSAGFVALLSRR